MSNSLLHPFYTSEMLTNPADGIAYAVIDFSRTSIDTLAKAAVWGKKTALTYVRQAKAGEIVTTYARDGKTVERRTEPLQGGEAVFINLFANSTAQEYVPTANGQPNGWAILSDSTRYRHVERNAYAPVAKPSFILPRIIATPTVILNTWGPNDHQYLATGSTLKLNDLGTGNITGIDPAGFEAWSLTDSYGNVI